jgi:hypothetical protein
MSFFRGGQAPPLQKEVIFRRTFYWSYEYSGGFQIVFDYTEYIFPDQSLSLYPLSVANGQIELNASKIHENVQLEWKQFTIL